ncbi:uncharacterized protein LOC143907755 [Temnothorax americanus]|uniref:uncharacterized protein LOC143907755 n=1 Tax=Temnothorax americanus TaxID=1964332 RepID=UPI0040688B31
MSNKRKRHSVRDEDKENELRKEIKRLKKRIDRQKKDKSCGYQRDDKHGHRSYPDYHDRRYREERSSRHGDRRVHYNTYGYYYDRRGRYSSRSASRERRSSQERTRSPNQTQNDNCSDSHHDRGSRGSSVSNNSPIVSSRHRGRSQSSEDVDPKDTTPISDAGEQNQVALTDQVVQSGQVAQRSTPVQGLNQSEEKSLSAGIQKEPDLAPEILEAIGERVHPDRKLAPAIHTKFVAGIEEVIKKGLPADKKKGLLEKFPSPENCLMMDPPKLNPELKVCLQETITKRDGRIVEKQARITTSLAGLLDVLVKITSLKSEEKLPTKELTESLWGVLQLMADLQHVESSVRRSLIVKNINASMRETLNATTVGEWLFGEKLEEKVKAAKTLEYSSKSLKPNTQQNQTGQSKNSKRPLRRQPSKWTRNSASSGRRPYQSYQKQKQPSRQSTQLKDNQSVAKKQE